jgi:hypothetical protein
LITCASDTLLKDATSIASFVKLKDKPSTSGCASHKGFKISQIVPQNQIKSRFDLFVAVAIS